MLLESSEIVLQQMALHLVLRPYEGHEHEGADQRARRRSKGTGSYREHEEKVYTSRRFPQFFDGLSRRTTMASAVMRPA